MSVKCPGGRKFHLHQHLRYCPENGVMALSIPIGNEVGLFEHVIYSCFSLHCLQEYMTCSNKPTLAKKQASELERGSCDGAWYTECKGTNLLALHVPQIFIKWVSFPSAMGTFDRL